MNCNYIISDIFDTNISVPSLSINNVNMGMSSPVIGVSSFFQQWTVHKAGGLDPALPEGRLGPAEWRVIPLTHISPVLHITIITQYNQVNKHMKQQWILFSGWFHGVSWD